MAQKGLMTHSTRASLDRYESARGDCERMGAVIIYTAAQEGPAAWYAKDAGDAFLVLQRIERRGEAIIGAWTASGFDLVNC